MGWYLILYSPRIFMRSFRSHVRTSMKVYSLLFTLLAWWCEPVSSFYTLVKLFLSLCADIDDKNMVVLG